MHEASAAIAGGSIDAVDRILAGEVSHAFNPGGGLHHAMAARASGFCIYNDVALGGGRARDAGHRVLYVDLDVHHGDGTQALFWDDPAGADLLDPRDGTWRCSRAPASWTSAAARMRRGRRSTCRLTRTAATAQWLAAVEKVVPALADAFRPTFLVTQHGCDTHAYDPLAHLRLTTRAYRAATTLLDEVAHDYCEGRWLATGGGGYDAYRVVPRSWSLVWLAQSHARTARPRQTRPGVSAGRTRPIASTSRRCRRNGSIRRTWSARSQPSWPKRMQGQSTWR